jgi:hypothetical protein
MNRTEQASLQTAILGKLLSFLRAARESSESCAARLRNRKQRTAVPFVTMLQAAVPPPVFYGCKVVLRTICWILAPSLRDYARMTEGGSGLTPLRKNDKRGLTPLRKNDKVVSATRDFATMTV